VFDFEAFTSSAGLRDAHHPVSAPLVATIEALLADARRAQVACSSGDASCGYL
jgi:hypothetical protein